MRSAAYRLILPLDWTGGSTCCWATRASLPGREEDDALVSIIQPVSLDYFVTLGIDVMAGRAWTERETEEDPLPVVASESLARELAGSPLAALGTRLTVDTRAGRTPGRALTAIVVGVARDSRSYGLDQRVRNQLYLPIERIPIAETISAIAVRVEPGRSAGMPQALRRAVWAAAPELPVPTVRSMRDAVVASTAGRRFDSVIFGLFAAVALVLAAGGLYGTLLYVAGQRKRELGIRVALGASRGHIEGQVLRTGLALGGLGLAAGLAGSWGTNRLLESRVWGVEPGDPWTLGGAALVLLATAALASWLPARRAGRVDPLETLRVE